MSLLKLTLTSLAGIGVATAAQAAPLVSLGDSTNLYFNGSAGVRNESNVLQVPSNEQADTIFIFSPGFELVFGEPGYTDISADVLLRENILRYSDNTDLNAEQPDFSGNLDVKSGMATYTGTARYYQAQTNSVGAYDGNTPLAGAAKRNVANVSNYLEVALSPKTSIATGVDYDRVDYKDEAIFGYTDYSDWSVPLDVYYELSPKTDLSLGYRYRSTNVDEMTGATGSADATDNYFTVGLRGELAPKLTGQARIGYVSRSLDNPIDPITHLPAKDHEGSFFTSVNVNYAMTPLVVVGVNAFRDFGVSQTGGSSTIRTGGNVTVNYQLARVFTLGGNLGYYKTDFRITDRKDDYYIAGVSLTYAPNDYLSLSAGYTYSDNTSNHAAYEFQNNVVEFTALFRY